MLLNDILKTLNWAALKDNSLSWKLANKKKETSILFCLSYINRTFGDQVNDGKHLFIDVAQGMTEKNVEKEMTEFGYHYFATLR